MKLAFFLLPVLLLAQACGPDLAPTQPEKLPASAAPTRGRGEEASTHRFAIVDRNVLRAARQIVPLIEYLERVAGVKLEMVYFEDYDAQLEALVAGRVSLAWISPTSYVKARRAVGVIPLVRPVQGNRSTYRSLLVVRRELRAEDLGDLEGRTVAFVRPDSTSGNVFPRAFLAERGIDPEVYFGATPFAGSHYQALFGVVRDEYDAAFVEDGTLSSSQQDLDPSSYEVLLTAATIPHGPIVAHPTLPARAREALVRAFERYATEPLSADLRFGLAKATRIQSFRVTHDEDYAEVRRHLARREAP